MVIRHDDRISTVIGRDESLVDVFVALSPAFARLRSRAMRKVMARLVTVEQAARMAGVDAEVLVGRLNAHITGTAAIDADRHPTPGDDEAASAGPVRAAVARADGDLQPDRPDSQTDMPAALRSIAPELRVEVDVRAELRAGREPFSQIMAALREVAAGGALAVRATFEPVPLYAVMRRQGLAHYTEQVDDDDWRAWFFTDTVADARPVRSATDLREDVRPPAAVELSPHGGANPSADDDVVVLDVRGLEPPEPMVRTLAALETLPPGGTLVQLNVRVPQFLLPLLEERGFTYDVREQKRDLVRVFIRHPAVDVAADS